MCEGQFLRGAPGTGPLPGPQRPGLVQLARLRRVSRRPRETGPSLLQLAAPLMPTREGRVSQARDRLSQTPGGAGTGGEPEAQRVGSRAHTWWEPGITITAGGGCLVPPHAPQLGAGREKLGDAMKLLLLLK